MSIIWDFSYIYFCDKIPSSQEVIRMMDELEFIIMYLQASDEIRSQVESVLEENQQCSDHED